MAFKNQNHEKYARNIDLNLEEFDEMTNRMTGYLHKLLSAQQDASGIVLMEDIRETINPASIKNSFFIHDEILQKQKIISEKRWITKNKVFKTYGNDIEKAIQNFKGYAQILDDLKLSSLKITRRQLIYFCEQNNLKMKDF